MKPEDIPQWAWDEADDTAYNIETDGHGSIEYTEARASIARLVMKARSQAYEECAKIAESHVWDNKEGLPPYVMGAHNAAQSISQAIRKGGNQ